MSNGVPQQDTFSERSKMLDIALKFTNGDIERAKLMVSGQYYDAKIIKGKFDIINPEIFGMFLIFINIPNKYIMNINGLILKNNNLINKASIFDSWKTYYTDFKDYTARESDNALPSYDFLKYFSESFENYNIYSEIETENLESITGILTEIICKFYTAPRSNCKISLDSSSSLNLEMMKIPIEEPISQADNQNLENLDNDYSERIAQIESKANIVINGRVIISPIKGKFINDIKVGEKIKIQLTGAEEIYYNVARSLRALSDENEILPVNMRVVEKFPMEKSGYYIYGLVAKNILVRVIEEENIKIETDIIQKVAKSISSENKNPDGKIMLYLVLLLGVLIILIILIITIM